MYGLSHSPERVVEVAPLVAVMYVGTRGETRGETRARGKREAAKRTKGAHELFIGQPSQIEHAALGVHVFAAKYAKRTAALQRERPPRAGNGLEKNVRRSFECGRPRDSVSYHTRCESRMLEVQC